MSKGQSVGPSGITLSLKKKDKTDVLKSTVSKQDGAYTFEKVIPGDYIIEASHPVWKFDVVSGFAVLNIIHYSVSNIE